MVKKHNQPIQEIYILKLKRARKYNKKVQLYEVSSVADGFGGYTTTDALVGSFWVYMSTLSASNRFNSNSDGFGTIDSANGMRFVLRHNPNVTFNYKTMYFTYRGDKYTIQNNSINVNYSDNEIELFVTKDNSPNG